MLAPHSLAQQMHLIWPLWPRIGWGSLRCLDANGVYWWGPWEISRLWEQPGTPATWTTTPLAGTPQIRSHVIRHQPKLRLAFGWGFSGDRLAWMLAKIAILGGRQRGQCGQFPKASLYESHLVPVLYRYGLSCAVQFFQVAVQQLLDPLSCSVDPSLASAVAAALQSAIALPPWPSRPGRAFLAETQR